VEVRAYCVKCRGKKVMKDAKEVTMRNSRLAAKGTCPDCGTQMFKFLPKKE
jgi:RNase P subunit RPR2